MIAKLIAEIITLKKQVDTSVTDNLRFKQVCLTFHNYT